MSTSPDTESVQAVSDRLLEMLRTAKREPRRIVEDAEYLAMLWRMARGLEKRTIENPQMIPQVLALVERLSEIANVAIAANAERYSIDPMRGASMMECARLMGISKQSASERRARGSRIISERIDQAGAVRFSEAHREKAAINAAAEFAQEQLSDARITQLAEYRARHRAA